MNAELKNPEFKVLKADKAEASTKVTTAFRVLPST